MDEKTIEENLGRMFCDEFGITSEQRKLMLERVLELYKTIVATKDERIIKSVVVDALREQMRASVDAQVLVLSGYLMGGILASYHLGVDTVAFLKSVHRELSEDAQNILSVAMFAIEGALKSRLLGTQPGDEDPSGQPSDRPGAAASSQEVSK